MADFYLIIVISAVFLYLDEKDKNTKRQRAKRRIRDGFNRIRSNVPFLYGVLFMVRKRRAFLWRFYHRITYREFTIPAIRFV